MKSLLLIFTLFFSLSVAANDLMDLTLEDVSTSAEPSKARQEIVNKIIEKITLQETEKLLGADTAAKKLKDIQTKVIPQSGKFIPYLKPGRVQQRAGGYAMQVELRFSRDNLKQVLQQAGVLYLKQQGDVQVLYMVSFLDQVGSKSYKWWLSDGKGDSPLLKNNAMLLNNMLKAELAKDSFQLKDPFKTNLSASIPADLKTDSYSTKELQRLALQLGAQVVVDGKVFFGRSSNNSMASEIRIELQAVIANNGRRIADIKKTQETAVGDYQQMITSNVKPLFEKSVFEMRDSIYQAWQKGLFDSQSMRIVVNGNLNYLQYKQIKDQLSQGSGRLKNLSDRGFEPGRVVFEADVADSSNALVTDLQRIKWQGKPLRVSKVNDLEIQIDLN